LTKKQEITTELKSKSGLSKRQLNFSQANANLKLLIFFKEDKEIGRKILFFYQAWRMEGEKSPPLIKKTDNAFKRIIRR